MVVVILAIAAVMVVPMMSSGAGTKVLAAAQMVAADLEYAKSMAITRGRFYRVTFDSAGQSYQVEDPDGTVIAHPVNKGLNYVFDFDGGRLDGVQIDSADFDGTAQVRFDSLGSPYNGDGESSQQRRHHPPGRDLDADDPGRTGDGYDHDRRLSGGETMGLWTWKRRTIGPIGLDIGHDSVKMLQLSSDGQTLSVHRLIRRRLPASCEDEQIQRQGLILTIRRMLEEGDFHGLQAAVCLANDKLKVTSIRLPESDVTQTTAQLYKEAALRFGLDPGQDPIQYIPAGTVRQGDQIRQEVILLATGRQAIEEDLAVLDQVGLTAVGLEPMPCRPGSRIPSNRVPG